jgi:hypothetical protein
VLAILLFSLPTFYVWSLIWKIGFEGETEEKRSILERANGQKSTWRQGEWGEDEAPQVLVKPRVDSQQGGPGGGNCCLISQDHSGDHSYRLAGFLQVVHPSGIYSSYCQTRTITPSDFSFSFWLSQHSGFYIIIIFFYF